MEEADTLCSRIGIMALGTLRCLGSQHHLKAKFGDGYKLVVGVDEHAGAQAYDAVTAFVQGEVCAGGVLAGRMGSTMTFVLPTQETVVSKVFNVLETSKARVGILNWSISQASLEEVFVKISTASEEADAAAAAATSSSAGGAGAQ